MGLDLQKITDEINKGNLAIEAVSALLPGLGAIIRLGIMTVKLLGAKGHELKPFEELAAQYDALEDAIKQRGAAWRAAHPDA